MNTAKFDFSILMKCFISIPPENWFYYFFDKCKYCLSNKINIVAFPIEWNVKNLLKEKSSVICVVEM